MKLQGLQQLFTGEGKSRTLTDEEVTRIRREGLGNGFGVVSPADGYRGDGSLWFGNCSVCNERVTNSWRDGVWKHTNYTKKVINANGFVSSATSNQSDYCPKVRGVVIPCEVIQN